MGSVSEAVVRCIQEDVFLQEALARGIVGYRKMARWLQEHRDVEGSEATIAQAIQRNEPEEGTEAMAAAWRDLQRSRVDHRGGLASVTVALTGEVVDSLSASMRAAEPERGSNFRLLQDGSSMTVVVDGASLSAVLEEVDERFVERTRTDLAELRIVPPVEDRPDGERRPEPAVESLVVAGLTVNGCPPIFTIAGPSGVSVFVDEADSRTAFDLLERLTT